MGLRSSRGGSRHSALDLSRARRSGPIYGRHLQQAATCKASTEPEPEAPAPPAVFGGAPAPQAGKFRRGAYALVRLVRGLKDAMR